MRGKGEQARRLPREVVIEAALECGIPAEGMEARNFNGRPHKVELVSSWGWATASYPAKVNKAREIADLLQAQGLVCAFDVLETGGLDVIFELM